MVKNTESSEKINIEPVKQKRGRKSKKDILKNNQPTENVDSNIIFSIDTTGDSNNINNENNNNIDTFNNDEIDNITINDDKLLKESKITKKRGRKPKGGKIIQQPISTINYKDSLPNIILHLKCSLNDLLNNNNDPTNKSIGSFEFNKKELNYDIVCNNNESLSKETNDLTINNENVSKDFQTFINVKQNNDIINDAHNDSECSGKKNMRVIWNKLKELEQNLHTNNVCDKKSACFWCTYDFDNPPIYIPKCYIKESYHVYGCFCSPECAAAHLMEESIDNSSKFERYFLLNHIYSKIYDYTKNIKPAPNPKFMLEKYYGNLTIQEYRALFKNDRLFLIVDKPLTRILPELHEDNDDFIINNKVIPSNTYQIIKNQKKQTKNNIISEKFGIS